MTRRFVVTGTDTGIGKTVFSAGLVQALGAQYWKPVQAGLEDETDSQFVERMAPRSALPEAWRLNTPASPHLAARLDGVEIDATLLNPPAVAGSLVIEGAGGALVPLNARTRYADVFARWQIPVIICARTSLGTINHSLMTIEALRARHVPIHGIAFIGEAMPDSEEIIPAIGNVRNLGRLPMIEVLTPRSLADAFAAGFDIAGFA